MSMYREQWQEPVETRAARAQRRMTAAWKWTKECVDWWVDDRRGMPFAFVLFVVATAVLTLAGAAAIALSLVGPCREEVGVFPRGEHHDWYCVTGARASYERMADGGVIARCTCPVSR